MFDNAVIFSRPEAAATSLGANALDAHRFLDKSVLVVAEPAFVNAPNGALMLDACVRLLPRMCKNVHVQLAGVKSSIAITTQKTVDSLGLSGVQVTMTSADFAAFDAVLVLGSKAVRAGCVVANSNGWLARVTTCGDLGSACDQINPIGAFGSACLACAEVFKCLISVKPERAPAFSGVSFSFLTYRSSNDPGFALPASLTLDILMVGCGAIGSATTYLLTHLPLAGSIDIVDPQVYEPENIGTSIIVGQDDIGREKAATCAALLTARGLAAKPYKKFVRDYARLPHPKSGIVLSGLDSVLARHELQGSLWPDVIIDGGTGAVEAQVFRHIWKSVDACLKCFFVEPPKDALSVAADATGLSRSSLTNQESLLTQDDIDKAAPGMRAWLSTRKGKSVCSIVQEAVANSMSATSLDFAPSAPFVAGLSATMIVAELVKLLAGHDGEFDTCYQCDTLVGPHYGEWQTQLPKANCECQVRRVNIERFRARNRGSDV
jgi:molybdopterin/thiamine biosynthesis adenylyltransferase